MESYELAGGDGLNLNDLHQKFNALDCMVSPLTMGTATWGRTEALKNFGVGQRPLPSMKSLEELIEICHAAGINMIDTAPAYGLSEERIGELLQGKRDKFIICTKTGEFFEGGKSVYNFSKKATEESILRSLKNLRSDYIDCVNLHLSSQNELEELRNSDALEVLLSFKQKGIIRALGASTHSIEGTKFAIDNLDLVMVNFNAGWTVERENISMAQDQGKFVMIKKGLYQGHLNSIDAEDPIKYCMQAIRSLGKGVSLVMGTTKKEHLRQNITSFLDS